MYYDITSTADSVSSWPSLGVKLPKQLQEAIDVFEALKYVETGYQPQVDLSGITPQNAEAKVQEFAEQLVYVEEQRDSTGAVSSILGKAKRRLLDSAAREVLGLGRAAVPEVVKQLTPKFDEAAAEYTEAVLVLPDEITSDSLVTAGPAVVSAYQTAQNAVGYLGQISSWVASTANLGLGLGTDMEVVIRILRPENGLQLAKLEEAHQLSGNANAALRALDPIYVAAARHSVPFGINTLTECKQIRDSFRLRPQALAKV